MKTGAIIPVYNEEDRIGGVLKRFAPGLVDEVVVIDDGSTDKTGSILAASGATVIHHPVRRGVGAGLRDGLLHLRSRGFDAAVIMAGNGKDDPREIPLLTAPLASGEADYVQGSRFLDGGSYRNLPPVRHAMIRGYTLLWTAASGRRLTDVTNGFRAYRLALLDDERVRIEQDWLDTYELEYYLHYKALSLGYRFREVAVSKNYPTRKKYSKIRPVMDWWSIVKPILLLRSGIKS
ncbi:MAG TPA: glycosyltransferase family 2 protein [Pyrinomonadaceae bacterium]|jgi:dolichol-phosphate mannosyltransferase|nr:glycosyltransferase family 2 protein [Pyrinomonadaceae bacterium]